MASIYLRYVREGWVALVPRLTSFWKGCWSTLGFAFLAPDDGFAASRGHDPPAATRRLAPLPSPVQQCRNIDHNTTLERGTESTRQDMDQTAGSSMFHLGQRPRITMKRTDDQSLLLPQPPWIGPSITRRASSQQQMVNGPRPGWVSSATARQPLADDKSCRGRTVKEGD
jgi:hypothetical protein